MRSTAADFQWMLVTVVIAWITLVESLLERSFGLQVENNTLAALRDTPLPNLISGEVRVKDAEHVGQRSA
jgi:hypothetical protein